VGSVVRPPVELVALREGRREIAALVHPTDEPRGRLASTMGAEGAEYQPVHPTPVVEAEADATVMTFSACLRPRIHRLRTDLTPADVEPPV
jgi:hypothetical protein